MKNVILFACPVLLTLGASAQAVRPIGPITVAPNARNGEKPNAGSITVADHAASGQSANAVTKSKPVPSHAVPGPHAVPVPPTAKK